MSSTTVAIELLSDRIDVAALKGGRVAARRRVPIKLPNDPTAWAKAVAENAEKLRSAVEDMGLVGAPANLLYRSPTQAVDFSSFPVRAAEALQAAELECTDALPYSADLARLRCALLGRDHKGDPRQHHVIAAAERVVRQCPWVRFLLVGDGVLRTSLERRIAAAGLADYFQFVGLVEPERIPAMIGAMDALVHASLREGLARALPQALIAGKPVISYDVDGAREVVIPGETGFLVAPEDPPALAEALQWLREHRKQAWAMGIAGRERAQRLFSREAFLRDYQEVLDDTLVGV